jgi:hypothetical protein
MCLLTSEIGLTRPEKFEILILVTKYSDHIGSANDIVNNFKEKE